MKRAQDVDAAADGSQSSLGRAAVEALGVDLDRRRRVRDRRQRALGRPAEQRGDEDQTFHREFSFYWTSS